MRHPKYLIRPVLATLCLAVLAGCIAARGTIGSDMARPLMLLPASALVLLVTAAWWRRQRDTITPGWR